MKRDEDKDAFAKILKKDAQHLRLPYALWGIPYFDSHIYGSYLIFTNLWHGNSPTNRVGSPIILSCHGRKDPRRLSGYKINLINYAILDAKNYVPYSRLLKKNHESIQQKSKNNRTEDRRLSAQKFSNPNTRLKRKVQT